MNGQRVLRLTPNSNGGPNLLGGSVANFISPGAVGGVIGGGGGLLLGLLAHLRDDPAPVRLFGCEPYNYPKYARFDHARSTTIADGLLLEVPHPAVQKAIADAGISISMVAEADIRAALRGLFETQGLVVEPSSAITLAFIRAHAGQLEEPICAVLTGENIARDDHRRLLGT